MPSSEDPIVARAHDPLSTWLGSPSPNRALIIEDGSTGSVSPVARWIDSVRTAGSHDVVAASLGPAAGLVLERDILVYLYREIHPDYPEVPATFSLARLRDHVRGDLRADDPEPPRLVVLDRVNWAERSLRRNLGHTLGDLRAEQKVLVSLRIDGAHGVDVSGWCEELGWRTEETFCVRIPAWLEGSLPPMERARMWADACLVAGGPDGARVADVLDVLAAAARSMRTEEVAALLDLDPRAVTASVRHAPSGSITLDSSGRYAFHDPTVARAWIALRGEANARVCVRLLALGEAALRGEARNCSPYVREVFGSLLGEHGGLDAQIAVVSEPWANAWSSAGNLLGFEADVERVWAIARRELLGSASAPVSSRLAPLLAFFRCVQASSAAMYRARDMGTTAGPRATALVALAEEVAEPERTRLREHAADALLAAELTTSESDLLMRLATWVEGARRDAILTRVVDKNRADIANGGNPIWFLRVAPLLSTAERWALVGEVVGALRDLPEEDAWALRDALGAAPELAPELVQGIALLPRADRFRFECALAPHLKGDERQRIVEAVLATVEARPFALDTEDLRAIAPALDAEQLSRLFRALFATGHDAGFLGICVQALCARGRPLDAESLVGPDLASMPFDWILALAGARDTRSELREELARQLSAMDETRLGWTIERDAGALVGALGAAALIRLARSITTGEERIVARLALVPFVAEAEKRALVDEAAAAFRAPTGQESLYWRELLACWKWMSLQDACNLLVQGCRDIDALWALKDFAPLLGHLAGRDAPLRLADQILEVGCWMP